MSYGTRSSIRFKKPGTSTLFTKFVPTEEEISTIKTALAAAQSIECIYLELVDAEGVVHASIEKTIYIRKKESKIERR